MKVHDMNRYKHMEFPEYKYQEYPKHVTDPKTGKTIMDPQQPTKPLMVRDKDQEDKVLGKAAKTKTVTVADAQDDDPEDAPEPVEDADDDTVRRPVRVNGKKPRR